MVILIGKWHELDDCPLHGFVKEDKETVANRTAHERRHQRQEYNDVLFTRHVQFKKEIDTPGFIVWRRIK